MGLADYFGSQQDPYQSRGTAYEMGDDDLVRRLHLLTTHMPKLRRAPTYAMNMAMLPVADDDLIRAVRRSDTWQQARDYGTALMMMKPERQAKKWSKMDAETRALLRQAGYTKPVEEPDRGWLDRVTDYVPVVGSAKAIAKGDVYTALQRVAPGGEVIRQARKGAMTASGEGAATVQKADIPVVSDVIGAGRTATGAAGSVMGEGLQKLNTFGMAPAHGYRFLKEVQEREGGSPWVDAFASWNPANWSTDAWEETGRRGGEGYWPDHIHERIKEILPNDRRSQRWAMALAMGDDITELADRYGKPDSPEWQQSLIDIVQRTQDSDFQSAMRTLELGKVSFGRVMAQGVGLDAGTTPYKLYSGLWDLGFVVALDPLLIAGKVRKGYMAMRLGITEANAVGRVAALQGAEVGKALDAYGPGWREAIQDVSIGEVSRRVGRTTAFGEAVARAFREGQFLDDAGNVVHPALGEAVQRIPGLKGSIDTLQAWNQTLRNTRIGTLQQELGRTLTPEEVGRVQGITDASDVWNLLNTSEGTKALIGGEFSGFTRHVLTLPGVSYRSTLFQPLKINMEKALHWGRDGVRLRVPLGADEVQVAAGQSPVRVEDILDPVRGAQMENRRFVTWDDQVFDTLDEAKTYVGSRNYLKGTAIEVMVEAPRPAERRLYRVIGSEGSASALPDHLDPYIAQQLEIGSVWTDDLAHARTLTASAGPTARLQVIDVLPDEMMQLSDGLSAVPGREYTLADEVIEAKARTLGTVGDWVEVAGGISRAHKWLVSPASNLMLQMTHRAPEGSTIALHGKNFVAEAERLLDMGLSLPAKREWMSRLVTASNQAERRQILRAAMDHMFEANGVYRTPEGIDEAQRFLNGTKMAYARDGVDLMFVGGNPVRVGIAPVADHADGLALPSWRKVLEQSQRTTMMRAVFGKVNNSWVESFMGTYWKPSVLLRLGFIPRAAGEELLTTILRYPDLMKNRWLLRPLAQKVGEPLWALEKMAGASRYLRHFVSEETASHVDTLANAWANYTSGWIRGMAMNALPIEEQRFFRAIAQNPSFQDDIARALPSVTGSGLVGSELPGPDDYVKIALNPEQTEWGVIRKTGSEFKLYVKGVDQEHMGILAYEFERNLKDDVMREVFAAGGVYMHPDNAEDLARGVRKSMSGERAVEAQAAVHDSAIDQVAGRWDEIAAEMRQAINDDSRLRWLLGEYMDAARGSAPDLAAKAESTIARARSAARTPMQRAAVEAFPFLTPGTQEALLVDERGVLSLLGALDEAQGDTLLRALAGLEPPAPDRLRVWVSSHGHPGDIDPNVLRADQVAFHAEPEDALTFSVDGAPAPAGSRLYYADIDADRYDGYLRGDETLFGDEAADNPLHMTADEEILAELKELPNFRIQSDLRMTADDGTRIIDGGRAEIIQDLMARARRGEQVARDELMSMAARQALDDLAANPLKAHYVRENERSHRLISGRQTEVPIAHGHTRTYVILSNEEGMLAARALQDTLPKEVGARMLDDGQFALQISDATNYGTSRYQPMTTWTTTSRERADEIVRQVSGDNPDRYAVGFVDVPSNRAAATQEMGLGHADIANWRPADTVRGGPLPADVVDAYREYRTNISREGDEAAQQTASDAASRLRTLGYDLEDIDVQRRLDSALKQMTHDDHAERMTEWSRVMTKKANQLSASPVDGRFLHEIGSRGVRKGRYDIQDIAWSGMESRHIPDGVNAPKFYVYDPDLWTKTVQGGFHYINKAIGAIAREPLFMKMAAKRYAVAEQLLRNVLEDPEALDAMIRLARAVPGRQSDVLAAYRGVWDRLKEADPRLTNGSIVWAEADGEALLREALSEIRVPGIKDQLLNDVKSHFAAMSGDEVAVLRTFADNQGEISRVALDSSLEGAIHDTVPYIDDHRIRSQYSEFMRNLTPFHFAEEQMIKRWVRTLAHSPEAIRRAQLLYMGIKHAGIVRQNEYGDDVWVIPGSAQLQQVLSAGAEALLGEPYTIPVAVPFTGSVKYTLPGLNRVGAPSFSPVVGIPMTLLARRFPELNQVNVDLLGEQAAGRDLMSQIMPASLKRVHEAIFSRPDTSAQYASAMIQAMQYMDANNLTPGPDASGKVKKEYIDRVRNWTRVMLYSRAILGFMSPAAPQVEFPDPFTPVLQKYLRTMPYEDAIREFMAEFPDATAYTVFTTKSDSGASMPTTRAAGQFLDNNQAFVQRHTLAAPWLLPQGDRQDATSRQVYASQMALGLRERKAPEEWLRDLWFAEAAPEYFASKDDYERGRLARADDPEAKRILDDAWRDWKVKFFKMNPTFAEDLQSRESHNRRINVLEDTRKALLDPQLPAAPHHTALQVMVESYYDFKSGVEKYIGDRTDDAEQARATLRLGFAEWGRGFIRENPDIAAYWQRNIEPEIGLSTADQVQLEGVR